MTNKKNKIFHLAIPTHSLLEAERFYNKELGFELCRKYNDRITLNFFDDQVVCHLCPEEIDETPKMYPRHFGTTFLKESDFNEFHQKCIDNKVLFFKKIFSRFTGKQEEHQAFFLQDPSNNLLEFKYYHDESMAY